MPQTKAETYPLIDRKQIREHYQTCKPILEKSLSELYLQLRELLESRGLSPTIKHRVKGFDSYLNKLSSQNRETTGNLPEVSDLLGLRVISPFLEDLDQIEQLILEHFSVVEHEHKGEGLSFREFGYDSVHLLIRMEKGCDVLPYSSPVCEIQLRTILQDAWAEVEHELVYKSDLNFPNNSIKRKLASLNASLVLSDLIFQEIRDYQKELRQRGIKRRQSIEHILKDCPSIDGTGRGEMESGEEILLELDLHNSPRGLEKLMFSALEAHSNKNFSLALQYYEKILRMKLEPAIRSLIYNHRGMALFALDNYQKAIEDFDKAIQFDGKNVRAWCNRGLTYRITGHHALSLDDYQQAIRMETTSMEGYWGRAQTYYDMQLHSQALNDCEQVLTFDQDFLPAQELAKIIRRRLV